MKLRDDDTDFANVAAVDQRTTRNERSNKRREERGECSGKLGSPMISSSSSSDEPGHVTARYVAATVDI